MAITYTFPDASLADEEGLVAAGGDLSTASLLTAYAKGIFPWYSKGSPILWWSPDPRMVLYPDKLRVSDSLRQKLRNPMFTVKADSHFREVIHHCAAVKRRNQNGTWITADMEEAYIRLHDEGFAHSFETWCGDRLVGGLYGVSLGGIFFGESMFYLMSDASKIAMVHLVRFLKEHRFDLIDAQQCTPHLHSLGGEEMPRRRFLETVRQSLRKPTLRGRWQL